MDSILINTTGCDGGNVFWIWIAWLAGAFILGIILGRLTKKGGAVKKATKGGRQDLTKIDDIGPKIQVLLNKAGIQNYQQLSQASQEQLKKILHDGGPAFVVHDPTTWSAQARLADEGKWDELEKWQEVMREGE